MSNEGDLLTFIPIDLERHAQHCVQFRRDAMDCSFEQGAERFDQESGHAGQAYLAWLRAQIAKFPEGCVHIWLHEQIIGQIELVLKGQQTLGYVNLVYLIPEVRGQGLGDQLHDYVLTLFEQVGVIKAQLSVTPTNQRAMAFYQKHGWQDVGPRTGHADVHLMERMIGV